MNIFLTITPRDPIIARDGRPFGSDQGARMKSLDWPYPSVLAGSLRSLLGKQLDGEFTAETVASLKQLEIAGPLPLLDDQLYFPAPQDMLVWEDEETNSRHLMFLRPRPLKDGVGCNLPHPRLLPVSVTKDIKPVAAPAFWSSRHMYGWLATEQIEVPPKPEELEHSSGFLNAPEKDERTHVRIDPVRGAADEGMLFTTVGLDFTRKDVADGIALAARAKASNTWIERLKALDAFHPLGGERRLLHWQAQTSSAWECPGEIRQVLHGARRIRMALATPALFANGWKPGWLNDHLQGRPPGMPAGFSMTLVGACVQRWQPLSGWSIETGQIGPKPVRRMVPAGSIYFFEVSEGCEALELADRLWLQSVSDADPEQQDQRDGFGLALWGIWTNHEEEQ